jgi:signal transduction histidine kinase/CheY-like chemotaxis protein
VLNYVARLLDTRMLSPHGICLLWRPELLWTHVVSDALIFVAYMTIPAALAVIIRQRRDIPFGWVAWCFALFITACGFTHLMGIWTLWHPDYGVEALVKAVTAAASIGTAAALWWLIPIAVDLPSPSQLRTVNAELRQRIAERDLAIAELENERAERLRTEEALLQSQKMDALGQLTGGIAHDFNNLLQAMAGSMELIKRRAADPGKVEQLAEAGIEATLRGAKLTGQLLAFARTKQLHVEAFAIADAVLKSRDLLVGAAGQLVELRFDLAPDELSVEADWTQIELALLNLVINARDAMPDGGQVVVRTQRVEVVRPDPELPAGAYVQLSVADDGAGMAADVRARAFDPFFTTKPTGQGTGLGLAQVYGAAKQAGGVARIECREGGGTTVFLLLPLAGAAVRAQTTTSPGGVELKALAGRILVVDDDAHVRAFVAEALAHLGLEVVQARDGAEAVERVGAARPDLVLMDYAMPRMNGADAAREIRKADARLPIVFMTGYADSARLSSAMGFEVAALRKPFRIEELTLVLARSLQAGARRDVV